MIYSELFISRKVHFFLQRPLELPNLQYTLGTMPLCLFRKSNFPCKDGSFILEHS